MTAIAFLGRQPILDRHRALVAYELLFRSGNRNAADVVDGVAATAAVITRAFSDLGLEAALGNGLGFINCDAAFLMSEAIEALPHDRMVLEVLETVDPSPEIVARCKRLREMGFMLALDDYTGAERMRELIGIVDFIKIDLLPLDTAELERIVADLKPLNVPLLAEKIDSQAQADHCLALGFEFFQGYFFAKPTIIEGRKLEQNQMSLLRLLGQVIEDADTTKLESTLKADPGLTVNLLRLVNSVGSGMRTQIQSLRHAITVLGRKQLQRWIQILLFAKPNGNDAGNPLLQVAATRGRLLETLAERYEPARTLREEAFLTGILSMMPALLGVSMAEVLKSLPLSRAVRAALTAGEGTLGALLHVIETLEGSDEDAFLGAMQALPGLELHQVFAAESAAMAWARQIGQPGSD